ncbi:General secretion pathway protein C [hydrothermal vent metagenome]|uniref:General secretion pathway protein C n=1 Tax=hydrothermal vent metagenome TaxID=652676 RepID=A0A1W1CZ87_9ZZZZ
MKNLFKPEMIKMAMSMLVLLLVIKLSWFVVQVLFLSVVDIDQAKDQSTKALYYRAKLTPSDVAVPVKKTVKVAPKIQGRIKEITLLAIYNDEDISIITILYKKSSKVLGIGDVISGFVFEGAGNDFAMFSKANKNYKVMLVKKGKSLSTVSNEALKIPSTSPSKKPLGEVVNEGGTKIIDRSLLEHYATNMDDIYKNIGITELKDGKKLSGFKINFIRKDSPFAKLGIRRNDTIKSINGQKMTSYNAGFAVYKDIKSADNLTLVIIRNNEEMELEYEIN